jgi:hypothetical protein
MHKFGDDKPYRRSGSSSRSVVCYVVNGVETSLSDTQYELASWIDSMLVIVRSWMERIWLPRFSRSPLTSRTNVAHLPSVNTNNKLRMQRERERECVCVCQ